MSENKVKKVSKENNGYEIYEQIRNARGMKDADVARSAEISKTVFSEWKSGRSVPKTDKITAISKALDCSVEQLIGKASLEDFVISDKERKIIIEYRNADKETRAVIDRLLPYSKGGDSIAKK